MENTSLAVRRGSHLTLHYRLALLDGKLEREVISTFGGKPATFELGAGHLGAPIEERLVGLTEGAETTIELAAGEAYGERNAVLVQTLSRSAFDANAEADSDYQPGDVVRFTAPDGVRISGVLKEIDSQQVVVDFNHPLAGRPVRFTAHIIGVL
ncbi:MAG: FKBP-type peptidyl-prolyl cis-trans isomerase [Burkholderiaceae bacterium]